MTRPSKLRAQATIRANLAAMERTSTLVTLIWAGLSRRRGLDDWSSHQRSQRKSMSPWEFSPLIMSATHPLT